MDSSLAILIHRLRLAIVIAMVSVPAFAQQATDDLAPATAPPKADESSVRIKNLALVLGEVAGVAWYGKRNWWQDGFTGKLRTEDEGWFGQETYAGGADKLGHFYFNYVGTRLYAQAFRHFGNDPVRATYLGAALALGTMTAVEVLDGYSKRWHFSKEDALMNALGTGTAILFEKYPKLDSLLDVRFTYRRSAIEGGSFDPISDYSGQTYVLVLKASGIPALRERGWLRYLELSGGYGVRNYAQERLDLVDQRHRQLYFGVSLNLSELLGLGTGKNGEPDRPGPGLVGTALEYIQLPGTAVYARRRLPMH